MVMVSSKVYANVILAMFVLAVSVNFVSAFSILSVTPQYVNRTIPTIINFTLNNTDAANITQVNITLPMEARFYLENNGTSALAGFANGTGGIGQSIRLVWTNTTWLVPNNSQARSFWFNATLRNIGTFFTNITIDVAYSSGSNTQTSYDFAVYFAFSGFTRNESGGNESSVNLSMYRFIMGQNGPPTEILESNILSDENGSFSFPSVNGSASLYTFKMYRYGPASNCIAINGSCNATKIGSVLPPFPAMMFYPTTADMPFVFEFMRPPSLNGTNFYMQPAATLQLYAHNDSNQQRFGYQVVDQVSGFPIVSNVMENVSSVNVTIPIDRNFTVMFARFPGFGVSGFQFSPACNGAFMNDSFCPSPPLSNSTLGTFTQGQMKIVNQSMIISNYRLWGCINITNRANNTPLNVTAISLKMVPWPGFVPPMRADRGDINVTTDINYSVAVTPLNCSGNFAFYNISVMGASSGINYMLELFAKNTSLETANPGSTSWNLATLQNISISNHTNFNLTLSRLTGAYTTSAGTNTSLMRINILNSTGGAITTNMNANIKVKHTVFGTVTYIIESMTNGVFYIPILNNSNWAKVMIFASDSPPKEITLNLSTTENNITLVSMWDGGGVGMKKINSSGQMEMINSTQLNASLSINMRFLRNTETCNIREPGAGCALTTASAKNFNPLAALVAGKINMEMKVSSTNATLTFVNFDMMSAKQPPMDSIMNDQASSGASSASQIWQFGSFAPPNTYDHAIISMPYSDSVINDSRDMNLSTPLFYDQDWNLVWNSSRGDTAANLSDDFIDYNSTALYRNYLNTGGLNCSKIDSNLNVTPCFVNTTTNMMYMRIPHFSGVGPNVIGSAVSSTTTTSSTTASSGGGGSARNISWSTTFVISDTSFKAGFTQELKAKERVKLKINNTEHFVGVAEILNSSVKIQVFSTIQEATINLGETKKFDVNVDEYYDLSVKFVLITGSKAKLEIKAINEQVVAESQTTSTTDTTSETEEVETETATPVSSTSKTIGYIVLIVLIAVLIVIVGIVLARNLQKRKIIAGKYRYR